MKPAPISEQYDFIENTFLDAGDKTPKRAVNINTVDEVPDSSWFTNRIGRDQWTTEQPGARPRHRQRSGAGTMDDRRRKSRGDHARADDPRQPPGTSTSSSSIRRRIPEMASGAEIISTKFFYAFGYHTPENYVATLRREALTVDRPGTRSRTRTAAPGRSSQRDLDDLLKKAARNADGSYRVIASKAVQRPSARATSVTTAPAPTIRTTSSRTNIAASCAGCRCSPPG